MSAEAAAIEAPPAVEAWPRMADEAFSGIAGELVHVISPYSEGDPVATLAHILVAAGNLIGAGPHVKVQQDRHPARLYAALVGPTSKGQKGLSWSTPRYVLEAVDPEWAFQRIRSGLSSGEGVIYHVRDARSERQVVREKGRVVDYQEVTVDHGEDDKRLLAFEPELASVFKRMAGDTNSLSAVLRAAWDDHPLGTTTKNSPLRATGAHVSLIGHVTAEELRLGLTEVERANGFGNRWLYLLVHRVQVLPDGEPVPDAVLEPFIRGFRAAVESARHTGQMFRDATATALWRDVYPGLSDGEPGLVGAVLGRGEAQVLRLSLIYALLDQSPSIGETHLAAVLAVWDYCTASARQIFGGDRLGLSDVDTIREAAQKRGPLNPLTTSEVYGLFSGHRRKEEIAAALNTLILTMKLQAGTRQTGGRSAVTWGVPE